MQTKALTEAAMMTATFIAMALMAYYIPLMSIVLFLFMGVPHALLARRQGLKTAILSLIVSALVLMMLMDIIFATASCVLFAITGIVLGACSKRYSAGRSILYAAIITAISFGILLVAVGSIMGIDIWGDVIASYRTSIELMAEGGQLGEDFDVEAITEQITRLATILKPSLILVLGFMAAYLNYRMFQQIGRRFKIEVAPIPLLFEWRFPTWVGIGYCISYMMVFFIPDTSVLYQVGLNVRTILYWPIVLQGLSLVVIFFGRYIRSKLFYVLITIVIFTNALLQSVVVLVGLFDMFFDYRGWIKEKGVLK